jgi:hypothetical protein
MSDSIDPARWLSDELANRDKRIEDLETRLHTSREAEVEEIVADVVDGRLRFTRETVLDIARRAVQAGREPLLKRIEELERQVQRLVQVARDVITERDSAKAEGARSAHEACDAVLDHEESLLPSKEDRTEFADGEASMVERVRKTLEFVRGGGRLRPRGDK